MTENMCRRFKTVWGDFPDQLDKGDYKFNDDGYSDLFTNIKCDNDIDKINVVSFWLFVQNFGDDSSFTINEKSNIDIVYYMVIWLIHMLRLKDGGQIDNVTEFYNKCINTGQSYINSANNARTYESYMGLINSKLCLMNEGIKDISKFYDAFKSLCNMYNGFNPDSPYCTQCLDDAKKFAKKYEILFNDTDAEDSLYSQILSILSADYYNFINQCYEKKEGCGRFPCLPPYSRCPLTKNALISITFIFVAIPIFLGFAYKHSLFGFGKRSQKQYLREKRKKIKSKMYNYILFDESDYSRNSKSY
ncbi:CIR protein [Plasmodium chabaudi adami]|uniref:CIR protein n=1 Tax=Plasmodium chabaudi adami TaxID=5826 RepID=A0A1D3L880_PLACE|nr:CIR protein [Plasmodium chabaudi adami]